MFRLSNRQEEISTETVKNSHVNEWLNLKGTRLHRGTDARASRRCNGVRNG
jgi:hypothetical protein